jgi:subtilisin family serine protease
MSDLVDQAGVAAAQRVSGADSEDLPEALEHVDSGGSVLLDEIGVAIVSAEPDQSRSLMAAAEASPGVVVIERERVVTIFGASDDYLRGYQAGVNAAIDQALSSAQGVAPGVSTATDWQEDQTTWGLQATRVTESCHTGDGVRVAVLDTGVDLTHRDLVGRAVTTASFIAGEDVQDGHGHGTHCIGTACGSAQPDRLPRYGVAGGAAIYAGKVLSNAGSGADRGILAGINWAVRQGCRVISMSLGAPTEVGDRYSRVYEGVARRALAKGSIIVAAAGNESTRPAIVSPVGHPANCPSILAVAALSRELSVAPFSCAGLNPNGGQIDLAAPGMDVLSSWPEPTGYRRLAGTSMATPHVAGILALLTEAIPQATPAELKNLLLAYARRLPLAATDVGVGLAQAP